MLGNQDTNDPVIFAVRQGRLQKVREFVDSLDLSYSHDWAEGYVLLLPAIANGHTEITKLLLKNRAVVNVNSKKPSNTPLHLAALNDDIKIVEMLLDRNANIHARNISDRTPLYNAIEKNNMDITELLLNRGADINAHDRNYITPLHVAAEKGHLEIVALLLNNGANGDSVCTRTLREGYTPLCLAVMKGHEKVVKLLMKYEPNVDVEVKSGKTILHLASENGSSVIVDHILTYCPSVNNNSNMQSLAIAVRSSKEESRKIVESLLQYGFTVKPDDISNDKLLHAAVEKGYLKIVEDLLKINSGMYVVTKIGKTLLHIATKNKQEGMVKLLISYGADVNANDGNERPPIFYAIKESDLRITNLLLINGANVKGNPYLFNFAVGTNCIEIVEILLQHGADVKASAYHNRTALHFTVLSEIQYLGIFHSSDLKNYGKEKIAKLLLSEGAEVNAQDEGGQTALHIAAQRGCVKVAEVLLKYNADVNAMDRKHMTPLHVSVHNGHDIICKMLLNKGANVNIKQEDKTTALHIAARNGYVKVAEVLLEYNASVNAIDGNCRTPLHLSVQNEVICKMLMNKGADVNAKQEDGTTALHVATEKGCETIVELLLNCGAKVNSNIRNGTLLYFAAKSGCKKIIEILLRFGANIDFTDQDGRTALHIACDERHKQAVLILLEYGSNINFTRSNYSTPLQSVSSFNEAQSRFSYFGSNESKKIEEILKQHIIKLRAAEYYVRMNDWCKICKDCEYKFFLYKCMKELRSLKNEKVNNISLHDILTKSINQLATYARNEDTSLQILTSGDYKTNYPIYADIIKIRFRKGIERNVLLEQVIELFYSLFDSLPELPLNCIEQILSHLSNAHLRIITYVYDSDSLRYPENDYNHYGDSSYEFRNSFGYKLLNCLKYEISLTKDF